MRRFNAMVERCRHQVYNLAYYSLGSRDEAEDVTQEVLIRLWENWNDVKRATAMAWIIRVTRNVCLDMHRKRQTRTSLMAVHGEACLTPEHADNANPEADFERKDFRAQVERALARIEDPYRTIVVLREIEGFSYGEICDAMQMPLNTVKVYLHRGRRMLRERMRGMSAVEGLAVNESGGTNDNNRNDAKAMLRAGNDAEKEREVEFAFRIDPAAAH
jgi:RNA polymerase sigma-70 factor (ECF subfamily)